MDKDSEDLLIGFWTFLIPIGFVGLGASFWGFVGFFAALLALGIFAFCLWIWLT